MARTPFAHSSDLASYPAPHLAVDLVLLTICEGELKVMMVKRGEAPFAGQFVLPGGFVHPGESLDDTARRVLDCKTGLTGVPVEQLYSFSDPERDPRAWVVTVAYFAVVPCEQLVTAMNEGAGLRLVTIATNPDQRNLVSELPEMAAGLRLTLGGDPLDPGFDHYAIIATALQRLRGKLDWSLVAFGLLPDEFTLFDLQRVHELILGRPLLKPPFRKKMLDRTFADGRRLIPTGLFSRPARHRPAELYRLELSRAN